MADTRCPAITYGGARVIVRCKYQDGHLPYHDHEAASVAEEAAFAAARLDLTTGQLESNVVSSGPHGSATPDRNQP